CIKFWICFISINVLFCLVDFTLLHNYHMNFNALALDSILRTNFNESFEFLQVALNFPLLVFVAILCGLAFASNFVRFIPSQKFLKIFSFIYIVIFLLFGVQALKYVFSKSEGGDALNKFENRISSLPVMRYLFVSYRYFSDGGNIKSSHDLEKFMDQSTKEEGELDSKNDIPNIIFVIGEGLQRNHMGIYGYDLDTTPNLLKLLQNGNVIAFSDTISPAPNTSSSLVKVLNFSSYESDKSGKKWYETLSLVDMMRLAGYKTFWLSNQNSPSYFSSVLYTSQMRCEFNYSVRENFSDLRLGAMYDEVLLDELKKLPLSDKNFIVLHLYGSHSKYKRRFPSSFEKFSISDVKKYVKYAEKLDNDKLETIADYDNSVFYNDFVVSQIYQSFANQNTLLIYFSDHGQIIYEDGMRAGHDGIGRFGYEIPLLFIASDKFKTNFPKIWQDIKNAKDKAFMTDDLIHTIAGIIGVSPKHYDEKRNVLSPNFNENRKRILGKNLDYDSLK
ncbi:MAG: phosphoethanolamine transferase, partial [Campylobacter sp.]|nr:phosphoethanolamine transferase [Campylobacter sp.]